MGTCGDLTGQVFGDWTVIGKGDKPRYWKCRCSCRQIKEVHGYSLTSGGSTSCGHRDASVNIKTGDTFGNWTVVDTSIKSNKVKCKCSCGAERLVSIYSLINGRSTGCGHSMNQDRVIDITGQIFGNLTAVRYVGSGLWECLCSCGQTCTKQRSHLLDGRAHTCGHDTIAKPENILGQRFGKLTPIKYLGRKFWECKCDCGNTKVVMACNLKNGSTVSCGCAQYSPSEAELVQSIEQFKVEYGRKPSVTELWDFIGITYSSMIYHLNKFGLNNSEYLDKTFRSCAEREIFSYISEISNGSQVLHNVNNVISPYELDVYLPEKHLAVEFNGVYWHSDLVKKSSYHQEKSKLCAMYGIRLIHVFEYEWKDPGTREKIKDLLKSAIGICTRVPARRTVLTTVSNADARSFYDKHHLQGSINSGKSFGLLYNNELVACMTVGTPRFDTTYQYEILRMAFKSGVNIVGGVSKLWSFLMEFNPESVISYCDFSKFTGASYRKLGMQLDGITKPGYVWVYERSEVVLTRYETMKSQLVQSGVCDADETADDALRRMGYYKIYNSGNLRFTWNKQ